MNSKISSFPLSCTTAKTGTKRADSPKTKVSKNTTGDYLSNFFNTLFNKYSPARDAKAHHPPIQNPNCKLRVPKTTYVILEPAVENRIMYIPVDDATDGGTPKLSSRGLKIAPPPRPKAPETQPPKRAKITNFKSTLC